MAREAAVREALAATAVLVAVWAVVASIPEEALAASAEAFPGEAPAAVARVAARREVWRVRAMVGALAGASEAAA